MTSSAMPSGASAEPRTAGLSAHGPGVSGCDGPPGPNLRATSLRTPSATEGTCGGLSVSKWPGNPVTFGNGQRGSVSATNPSPGARGSPEPPSTDSRSRPSKIQPPKPIACRPSAPLWAAMDNSALASVRVYCSTKDSGIGSSACANPENAVTPGMARSLMSSVIG
nr:hypothetical protein CPGR_00604 [Mycolicibacter nonchromogenicus]